MITTYDNHFGKKKYQYSNTPRHDNQRYNNNFKTKEQIEFDY